VVDADVVQAAVFSDPVPLKRRNELWVEVVPPSGAGWYDHASKIATDRWATLSFLKARKSSVATRW